MTETAKRPMVETTGIEIVAPSERTAKPRDLFWPWFAANVSVFGISYGAFVYGFGVNFWQGVLVAVLGIALSFAACGVVAIAGKRGSAPTMITSRAPFGVNGQKLPGVFSYLISMGWETFLAIMAVLATATIFTKLGFDSGVATKIIALLVVAGLTIAGSVAGYHLIMKLQTVLTWITGLLTVAYILLTMGQINFAAATASAPADVQPVIGALVMVATGFGLGWINISADWSRYQRRDASTRAIVFWNTLGGALAPVLLVIFGLLLIGSQPGLTDGISADPVGALAELLPVWFLLPFLIAAVLALLSGAVFGIYSSGLTLLSLGLKVRRPVAAGIDGLILTGGAVAVVFFAPDFLGPFQSFLITLGVPLAGWAGIMMADILLRRRDYDDAALFNPSGRYGSVNWAAVLLLLIGAAVGWGFVVNQFAEAAPWNNWQGYLLPLIGGRDGAWAYANLGVLFSLAIGFFGYLICCRTRVRQQERST